MKIFIKGNVPSSKNSRQWTGKFFIASKATRDFKKATDHIFKTHAAEFRKVYDQAKKPVKISFEFIRGTKHKFDYINPAQTIQDFMVDHEWIEDDNCDCIIPSFEPYSYDKENPGVWITLLNNQD